MHTVRIATAVVAAGALFALTGCMPVILGGPMTSEEREIDAITAVVLDTSGDLTITEGEPSLVIRAPEDALERLTSEVDGDTLVLGTTPGPGFSFGEVRYELTVPDLERIELNGSGDVTAGVSSEGVLRLDLDGSGDIEWTGLAAERIEIGLAGSGNIELDGTVDELEIQLDGSGSIDAEELESQRATVEINGSGDVDVLVRENLTARIAGSGDVTYSGDPSVDSEVAGSGEVKRR
jgi:hypothetical protein